MIILVGASASGKTEVSKILVRDYHYEKVVTYTTRPMRDAEINDIDYHFVSKEFFLEHINKGFFFETVLYNDNYYGTAKKDLNDNSVVILDPTGLNNYKSSGLPHLISFYLDAKEDVRRDRMIQRNDHPDLIEKRLKSDKEVFKLENIQAIDYLLEANYYRLNDIARMINDIYKKCILED